MSSALFTTLALLLFCLLPDRLPAAGVSWDWLGGIGFAALAFILALSFEAEAPARQPRLNLHRNLAIAALCLTLLHALGYLLTDSISFEYLKPTAPTHMLIGLVAAILLLILTLTSLPVPRRKLYASFQKFRLWHLGMSLSLLGTASWHVVGTGYVFNSFARTGLLLAVLLAIPLIAFLLRRRGITTTVSRSPQSTAAADRLIVFATLFSVLMACLYSVSRNS